MSVDDVKFEKSILVRRAYILSLSIEKRVIPRLRVLRVIKSKRLTKKEPSLVSVLTLSEKKFLDRFVLKYEDDVEELLTAYKVKFSSAVTHIMSIRWFYCKALLCNKCYCTVLFRESF